MRLTSGRAAAIASILLATSGCSDRVAGPTIDWPTPEEITGRLQDNCIIVDEGLKCWALGTPRPREANGPGDAQMLVLMLRDELFPSAPIPFVDLGPGAEIVATDSNRTSARCAAIRSEGVKCWGRNDFHYLGVPDPDIVVGDDQDERGDSIASVDLGTDPRVVDVERRCALFEDGRVKCWGDGAAWLGLGDTDTRGDEPEEMGDSLPYVDLGTDVRAVGLAGSGHMCVWTAEGRVKCWGSNARGQLGVEAGLGEALGDEPGEMGDALPYVDLGDDVFVVQVTVGAEHTCALTDEGRVRCWGANFTEHWVPISGRSEIEELVSVSQFGRLGLGDPEDRPPPLGEGLAYVDLGADAKVVAVGAGDVHTCALLDDAQLKCWGGNEFGTLGYGDLEDRGDEPGEMGDDLAAIQLGDDREVVAFHVDAQSTCALLDDDSIKCWGSRYSSGYVTSDDPGKMGNNLEPVATPEELLLSNE